MLHGTNFYNLLGNKAVYNCDVRVYKNDATPTLLLNGTYMSSFNLRRSNHGVLDEVPSDNCSIEINNWGQVSQSVKNELVSNAIVKVTFVINNEETTDAIVLIIDEVNEDIYDPNKVTMTLVSPIAKMGASSDPRGYYLGSYSREIRTMPFNLTNAIEIQQMAIEYAKGRRPVPVAKTTVVSNWDTPNYAVVFDLDNTPSMAFLNDVNVIKAGKYKEKEDKSNINVYGVDANVDSKIIIENRESSSATFTIYLDKQYYDVFCNLETKDNQGHWHLEESPGMYVYSQAVELSSNQYGAYGWRATVIAGDFKGTAPTTEKNFIQSNQWASDQTDRLNTIRDYAREYYSHNEYYEIECRIDPCIEPQDNVFINGFGTIRVEEVEIKYNGGFKGNIKGRKMGDTPIVPRPKITFSSRDPSGYLFFIENISDFDGYVHICYSGSSYYSFYVGARQSLMVSRSNAPGLQNSFEEKADDNLNDDVYCYLTCGVGYSGNTIILEADW